MLRTTVVLLLLFFQSNVGGPWAVTLYAPYREVDFRMFIVQKGSKLTGYMLSEVGQFDLEGSVESNQVKFAWTMPDGGKLVTISFTGKLEGNQLNGVAKVGDLGEGRLVAERRP
jgi:hypothetical protein